MRFNTICCLIIGSWSLLCLCLIHVKAEGSAQLRLPKIRQSFSFPSNRAEHINSDLLPPPPPPPPPLGTSVESAVFKPILIKRARVWRPDEIDLLLKLRAKEKSWAELQEYFPDRSWTAIQQKYSSLTRDPTVTKGGRVKLWTPEEKKLLLKLKSTNKSWEEIAEQLPGRSPRAIQAQHVKMIKGEPAPEGTLKAYTSEEDALLLKLAKDRVPWAERPDFFDGRSLLSLRHRYGRITTPNPDYLSKYTPQEDELLIEAVGQDKSIIEISQLLGRNTSSVRKRIRSLQKSKQLGDVAQVSFGLDYTADDFELIRELKEKRGLTWAEIGTEHFPGRTLLGLRTWYSKYKKRKARED